MSETQDYWGVHLAVSREDIEGIRAGAALTIPAERRSLTTELFPDGVEGEAELVSEVAAGSEAEAAERATKAYLRARVAGGLPAAARVDVIGLRSPILRDQVVAIRDEAEQLFSDGRHDLAVVRAQTACELWAKRALEGAFAARMPRERAEVAARLCRASLNHGRTQASSGRRREGLAPRPGASTRSRSSRSSRIGSNSGDGEVRIHGRVG